MLNEPIGNPPLYIAITCEPTMYLKHYFGFTIFFKEVKLYIESTPTQNSLQTYVFVSYALTLYLFFPKSSHCIKGELFWSSIKQAYSIQLLQNKWFSNYLNKKIKEN